MASMLPYIAAPWIRHGYVPQESSNNFYELSRVSKTSHLLGPKKNSSAHDAMGGSQTREEAEEFQDDA